MAHGAFLCISRFYKPLPGHHTLIKYLFSFSIVFLILVRKIPADNQCCNDGITSSHVWLSNTGDVDSPNFKDLVQKKNVKNLVNNISLD